jgi:hypothetical protein
MRVKGQRDLCSGAAMSWPGAEPLLAQAVSRLLQQSANAGAVFPQSFGLGRRQSGSSVKEDHTKTDVRDVVTAGACQP